MSTCHRSYCSRPNPCCAEAIKLLLLASCWIVTAGTLLTSHQSPHWSVIGMHCSYFDRLAGSIYIFWESASPVGLWAKNKMCISSTFIMFGGFGWWNQCSPWRTDAKELRHKKRGEKIWPSLKLLLWLEPQLGGSTLNERDRRCLSVVMVVFSVQQTMTSMGHSSNILPALVAEHLLCYS